MSELACIVTIFSALGATVWLSILILPWQPWRNREHLAPAPAAYDADLSNVTVLIPARNEAGVISSTLEALELQGAGLRTLVIDDQSNDGTPDIVKNSRTTTNTISLCSGQSLPEGWAGKLWALEQGRGQIKTQLALLLDADISLKPGMIAALLKQKELTGAALVSLMAELRMTNGWEKLLMPAFIFFFRLLYPFSLSNRHDRWVAAAAGGCVLIETKVLEEIGGFGVIRSSIIDDCALARAVKKQGYLTWIGITRGAVSQRKYKTLHSIWAMVTRSAYPQLLYSPALLLLCTFFMALGFWTPIIGISIGPLAAKIAGGVGFFGMTVCYLPTVRYYQQSMPWALTMPLIGTLYLAMTWHSAAQHWNGKGSHWKGRIYPRNLTQRSPKKPQHQRME